MAEFAAKVAIAAGEVSKQDEPVAATEPSRVPSVSPAASNGPHDEPKQGKTAWEATPPPPPAVVVPEPKEATPPPPVPATAPVPEAPAVVSAATPEVKEAPTWEAKTQRPQKQTSEPVAPEPTEKKTTPSEPTPEEGRSLISLQPKLILML